jgi:hypothetical protein
VIFHSYVCLPEGIYAHLVVFVSNYHGPQSDRLSDI